MPVLPELLVARLEVLLCDADGNLFPSEEPAFVASADVTNRFLADLGVDRRFSPEELRLATTGMNFRTTSRRLAAEAGSPDVDVEPWVAEEKRAVTAHLGATLTPHEPTTAALTALSAYLRPAAVSSSALTRLAACFTATGLDELIPPAVRFSAEDSLPVPTSKPDPAVYLYACEQLGIAPESGLAVEDSVPGALSAVRAGCPTVGNLLFVPEAERAERSAALLDVGVLAVVDSWRQLADLLLPVLTRRAAGDLISPGGAWVNIVFVAFRGHFSDSPRALYEALLERGVEATCTWLSAPHTRATFPHDVATVTFGSPESIAALEAADLVVSNDHIPLDWEKKPGARYLQTWHGTPLKRIHNDVRWAPEGRLAYLEQDIARWDLLLSPNAASTPRLRNAFGYRGEIHETGYPRNDLLSSPRRDAVRAAVRADLGISDDQTVVLYTPTWRDDLVFNKTGPQDFEFPVDLDEFTARLGEDHVLLLRLHNMVMDRLEVVAGSPVRDVCSHPDIRDLYLAADAMVTDYSSTMFDFAITGRPMLFFTYDLAYFRDELRGFYFDLEDVVPGPLVSTSTELIDAIADLDGVRERYATRYAEFQRTFCHLEDGHATERVLDLLFPPAPAVGTTTRGGDLRAR